MTDSASVAVRPGVDSPVDKVWKDCPIRARLVARARERGVSLAALSAALRRNPAYVHQFVYRGSPEVLAEGDRRVIAAALMLPESELGGPARAVPVMDAHSFAEEFARELWESGKEGRSWENAPAYWRDAYRRQGALAAGILRRRGLLV